MVLLDLAGKKTPVQFSIISGRSCPQVALACSVQLSVLPFLRNDYYYLSPTDNNMMQAQKVYPASIIQHETAQYGKAWLCHF